MHVCIQYICSVVRIVREFVNRKHGELPFDVAETKRNGQ